MKSKIIVTCLALLAVACGAEQDQVSTVQEARTEALDLAETYLSVTPVEGSIDAVSVRRERGKKVTDVTIGFTLGCLDKLENVATKIELKGNQAKILLSAHSLINKRSLVVRCIRPNYVTHKVTLKGSFKKANIKLQPLTDDSMTDLQAGDLALRPVDSVQVLGAGLICPPNPNGMSCMAVGSKVTLKVFVGGCMDRLGPVASHFEVRANGKVDLYVKVLTVQNEMSMRAMCLQVPTAEIVLSTPANIRARDLAVHVLK